MRLQEALTFDKLLHQCAIRALVSAVHDAVSYPRQVSHVAMPSSSLGPDRRGQTFRVLTGRRDETEKRVPEYYQAWG